MSAPSTSALDTGQRPVSACPPPARRASRAARCGRCGQPARDRVEVADLSVAWLVGDPTDPANPLTEARFHRSCAPPGPVEELACAGCGDGPLLAPALAHPVYLAIAAAVDDWLVAAGWRLSGAGRHRSGPGPGPWCPGCGPTTAPASATPAATTR